KRASLQAIAHRSLDHPIHSIQRPERRCQPLALEVLHDVVKPAIHFAEQVTLWNPALVEKQFRRVRRKQPDLIELLAHRKSLCLGREKNKRDALVSILRRAHRKHDEVSASAVGDPQFLAGNYEITAVLASPCLYRRYIRSATGLADS